MAQEYFNTEEITFGYCTEYFIKTDKIDLEKYKESLEIWEIHRLLLGEQEL